MSQGEKRLQAMRLNPSGDWQIADVEALCRHYGIQCLKPSGGSHYKVAHPSQREILTVVANRPIKAIYIKNLVQFVDAVKGAPR
jgi:hypothetical protein